MPTIRLTHEQRYSLFMIAAHKINPHNNRTTTSLLNKGLIVEVENRAATHLLDGADWAPGLLPRHARLYELTALGEEARR